MTFSTVLKERLKRITVPRTGQLIDKWTTTREALAFVENIVERFHGLCPFLRKARGLRSPSSSEASC